MNHWIIDIETLVNCFLIVLEHYKTNETHVFTIGRLRNDLPKLLYFLDENAKHQEHHISFNGLSFDSQVLQYIMLARVRLSKLSGEDCGRDIYKFAQATIELSNNRQFPKYSEKDLKIPQIDIFKVNHWDSPSKMSSLKSIQCAMNWYNVLDMPIHHTTEITTVEQLQEISRYCRNDVASTKAVMNLCLSQINLRLKLSDEYKINLKSASEPKLSKELFLDFFANKTGISKYELRALRTKRTHIHVKDIILPYVSFKGNPQFEELLRNFNKLIINPDQTKDSFKYSIRYKGVVSDFGLGGLHGARSGIYKSTKDMIIMSSDVN
jgi:hypothetical protein